MVPENLEKWVGERVWVCGAFGDDLRLGFKYAEPGAFRAEVCTQANPRGRSKQRRDGREVFRPQMNSRARRQANLSLG